MDIQFDSETEVDEQDDRDQLEGFYGLLKQFSRYINP